MINIETKQKKNDHKYKEIKNINRQGDALENNNAGI